MNNTSALLGSQRIVQVCLCLVVLPNIVVLAQRASDQCRDIANPADQGAP